MVYQSQRDFSNAQFLEYPRFGRYRDNYKRVFDVAFVLVVALPVLLVLGVIAALIALDGRSPIFWQERLGQDGKKFRMMKLRSMVPDADQLLEAYLESNAEARTEWDRLQKLKDDPRVTGIGRFIRKTSLDELPQLWNVLRGDMSLVGPRPMMTDQEDLYPGTAYFEMRPGITGYWQVSERNESSFAQRAFHDTKYYRELSWTVDFGVLMRTVRVVWGATGY